MVFGDGIKQLVPVCFKVTFRYQMYIRGSMNSVGLRTEKRDGKVYIEDSKEDSMLSNDSARLFGYMLEPYEKTIKVVWDVRGFIKPILSLLPSDMAKKLTQGGRIELEGFRIWLGQTRHGNMLGVSYKELKRIRGNTYQRIVYDTDIFELKQYFLGEPEPRDVYGVKEKGDYILSVLERMGLNPKRLTSAAAIYQECVLDKMPIPTIWNMPEESYPMMEMCANYVREWHGNYESKNWDKVETFKFDMSAAYPAALAEMPNLKYATFIPFEECRSKYYWAILKGDLKITSPLSTVVDEQGNNLIGEYEDVVISSDDWACLKRWKLGTFIPKSGWALVLSKDVKLFNYTMRRLYDYRGGNPVRDALSKAMAVSVIGKFMEMHGEEFGDYFNGIYASMVTSKVRSKVCDFIHKKRLQDDVLEITVDGLRSRKFIDLPKIRQFGEWRLVENKEGNK